MPNLEGWGTTDVGPVRENNEDAWFLDLSMCVAIVADGMGGAACGEVASAMTIETVTGYLRNPSEDLTPELAIKEAIREANRRVLERARREESCEGMGSTIVAACWRLPEVIIANVGDSRAYLWRKQRLTQLSYDQTLANELRHRLGLTDQQMAGYAHQNVLTMAVGAADDLLIQSNSEILEPGDEILLCSDGLHGPLEDTGIVNILGEDGSLQQKVERLIAGAKDSGTEDNITAVLLRWKQE